MMSAESWAWTALSLTWCVQGYLLICALRTAGRGAPRLGETLERRCAKDIEVRAHQGLLPDWQRYSADADRLFEPRGDRLRLLASSALAVGLFGTLAALLITLFAVRGTSTLSVNEMRGLIGGTLRSLGGSFFGVAVHLVIALVLLRWAEDRFLSWQAGFEVRLQEHADGHPPSAPFLPLLKEELARIRESLSGEFAGALAGAVTGFPETVRRLEVNIERLSVVIEGQDHNMNRAADLLAEDSHAVARAGAALGPVAERLQASLSRLETLPSALRQVLEESRESWLAGLGAAQEERLREIAGAARRTEEMSEARERQMAAEVRVLEAAVAEVRDAVGGIAGALGARIGEMADRLGTEFGREARSVTRELAENLERRYEQLLERMQEREQQARNAIGTEVEELFARVRRSFDDDLFTRLGNIGQGLDASAAALGPLTERLEAAHRELSLRQGEALTGWTDAGERIAAAAASLIQADGKVQLASGALTGCADSLGQVAVGLAMAADEAKASESRRDRLLDHQAAVLRDCIRLLAESGKAA